MLKTPQRNDGEPGDSYDVKAIAALERQLATDKTPDAPPQEEDLAVNPITSHFAELRKRMIYCVIAIAVLFFLIVSFGAETLVQLVTAPVKIRGSGSSIWGWPKR